VGQAHRVAAHGDAEARQRRVVERPEPLPEARGEELVLAGRSPQDLVPAAEGVGRVPPEICMFIFLKRVCIF
jgi:hypothetical protein